MKKGFIIAVAAAVIVGAGGAAGYKFYQQQKEAESWETQVSEVIAALPAIVVYEQEDLPSVEEEFAGAEDVIDIDSVQPDISNVYTTEPGSYTVNYTFNDVKGTERTVSVSCTVKPDLISHVSGMTNIEIYRDDPIPDVELTYDEYVDSVILNTESVDTSAVGTYAISWSILGADGEMVTADNYTCTVLEIPDLSGYVSGMKDIEITEGEAIPSSADVTITDDSKVASVTLNTGNADNQTPGTYPISYSIIGTDGKSRTVDGYTLTVAEVPETETETGESETENETETGNETEDEDGGAAVGNVEVQETVAETGDETDFIAIFAVLAVCLAAIAGVFAYRKKRKG